MSINVAVVGCGRMGQMHIQNLKYHPKCVLKAIVDESFNETWLIENDLRDKCASWQEVLEDKSIDAVIIAASTDAHTRLIQEAASAKKHIFCEKPISLSAQKIYEVQKEVDKQNVSLHVGFNRRFDSQFQRARQALQEGRLGQCQMIRVFNRDPKRPHLDFIPRSGGLFFDFNVHDFDTLRFVTGDEVHAVYARGANLIDPEIGKLGDIDTAIINVEMKSGVLAVIDTSRETHFGYDQRLEILGVDGAFEVDNVCEMSVAVTDANGRHSPVPQYSFVERYKSAYLKQMETFVESIVARQKPQVTGDDCYHAVVACTAARLSHEQNRRVLLEEVYQMLEAKEEVAYDH